MPSIQYPISSQTDVYINKPLVYIFPKAVKEISLYTGSVVLYDAKDHHVVEGILSYDATTFAVQFLPAQELTKSTAYTWAFTGQDDNSALPIEFEDNTKLANSIWIDFQTGVRRWGEQIYTAGGDPVNRIIEDGQTLEELNLDTFKVVSTSPVHMGTFVNVLTDTITIKFSKPVKTGQNLSSLLSMAYTPVHRETYYFNNDMFRENIIDKIPGRTSYLPNAERFLMPTGTWSLIAPDTIQWSKTPGQPFFNANSFVNVFISGNLLSSTDDALNSRQDEHLYFMTQLFPMYTNPEAVLLRLFTVSKTIDEDALLRLILMNSITAFRLANVTSVEDIAYPSRYAQAYTECATIVKLIDGKMLDKQINSGKAITLGDLQLNYGAIDTAVSLPIVRQEAAKCMDDAKQALLFVSGNRDFWVGERGSRTPDISVYGRYRRQLPNSYAYYPGYTGYMRGAAESGYLGYTGYLGRGGILTGGLFI